MLGSWAELCYNWPVDVRVRSLVRVVLKNGCTEEEEDMTLERERAPSGVDTGDT